MSSMKNATAHAAVNGLAKWCKAMALVVPMLALACPVLPPGDGGETTTLPSTPIKDPALWMDQAANQECPQDSPLQYAAANHLHFGRVWLINNPCRSGTNLSYAVFENYADRTGQGRFCAIGEIGGSMVIQLPSTSNGYVRIETYWHESGHEGTVTRYELRPSGVVQIGKARRVLQKPS